MTYRAQDQLATLKMQSRHPREHIQQRQQQQERTQPNSNSNDESNKAATAAAALSSLKDKHSQLQNELSRSTTVNKNLETEIITATKVTEAIDNEMTSHNKQYDVLSKELSSKENEVRELRQQFVNSHPATLTMGGSANGIIPGGPGHTLNQKREMESMESLEDYENYVQRREDALWDKIDLLITKIGRDSKREALEWFGMDLLRQQVPENEIGFKVELDVEYPKYDPYMDHNNGNDNPELWPKARGTFIIEMAPLEMMPIAINLFLQQVHHKLWNGCAFVINAMHILQAGPHQYKGEQGKYDANSAVLKSNFEKSRLDKIPFQEYHAEFPHEMYTVGFAGRPGGPDFYINKVDNSVNHGPGGQGHHDIHEEADPCFGRVIGGIELIQEINHIPVNREKGNLLAVPVTILNGRVLSFRRVNVDTVDGDGGRRVKGGGEGVMSPSEGGGSFNMPA
jgi:cyclophilin family peptidyl-prolyl cis-trans isomerase